MNCRSRPAALVLTAVALWGCPDKKPAPIVRAPEIPAPAAIAPPPPAAIDRAVKECAAAVEDATPKEVSFGTLSGQEAGHRLTFSQPAAGEAFTLGVLGPINEDSGLNLLALKKYLQFFEEEKAAAILVTGDVGEVADGIARVLKTLARSKLPVLVVIGNRECRAEYTEGLALARKETPNIVDLDRYRLVEFPALSLVSLPGYHDPNYINCATGCRYYKSTVDEVVTLAKAAKGPTLLVSHGPPHGEGSQALDYASSGGNVGDEEINRAIKEGGIAFGAFSNIKEAGARATSDAVGTTQLKQGVPSKTLYLNPGPADTVGWELNDNSRAVGLAAVISVREGQASFKLFRNKPPTPAEKAEAKKLQARAAPTANPTR